MLLRKLNKNNLDRNNKPNMSSKCCLYYCNHLANVEIGAQCHCCMIDTINRVNKSQDPTKEAVQLAKEYKLKLLQSLIGPPCPPK